jgi:hypothetical protein
MFYRLLFVVVVAGSTGGYADKLLDDFEAGGSRNAFNGEWFYFSDVKDEGNSTILNSTLLPNGDYSVFRPDTGGYASGSCAKLAFVLGDTSPLMENCHSNFVGIGTDLAIPGRTIDLRRFDGIRFYARGTNGVTICCELITSTVLDYAYHQSYFVLTDTWQPCTLKFSGFKQREAVSKKWPQKVALDLSKMQKITWKIFDDITGYYGDDEQCQASGTLEMDNICLTGADDYPVANRNSRTAMRFSQAPETGGFHFVNLAGRSVSGKYDSPPGVYIGNAGSFGGRWTEIIHAGIRSQGIR